MITAVNILLIIFWILIIPFLLGSLIEGEFVMRCQMSYNKMISRTYVFGLAFMLATFQIVAVPLIFIGASFTFLSNLWAVLTIVCATVSVCTWFYNRKLSKKIKSTPASAQKSRRSYRLKFKIKSFFRGNDKEALLVWTAALLVIAFQTALLILRQHTDTDDARFLAEALEAWERDSLLRIYPINGRALSFPVGEMLKEVVSPYPLFIAVLARLTMMHPTILAHSILPVFLIPLSYCAMYIIGRYFFNDKRNSGLFMLILSILVLFSFESVYSIGYTLLTIIWQGRSIFMTIILPLVFYVFIQIYTEGVRNRYIYAVLFMGLLAGADLSGMAIVLLIILSGGFALCELIINKKVKSAIRIGASLVPVIIYFVIYYGYLIADTSVYATRVL